MFGNQLNQIDKNSFLKTTERKFFFKSYLLVLLTAALGLCCCAGAFSCGAECLLGAALPCGTGSSCCRAPGSTCLVSVVAAHGLQGTGPIVVAHGLSCCAVCGIFLTEDPTHVPLHGSTDSSPLSYQRSPTERNFK